MDAVLARVVALVPRLKGPIQLSGFLFAVLAVALIRTVDPNNLAAMGIAGVIGVILITVPLAFHSTLIRDLPQKQRAWFLLVLLALMLGALIVLVLFTWRAIEMSADGARVDSLLHRTDVSLIDLDEKRSKLQMEFSLVPMSRLSATVFAGVVTVHDESLVEDKGVPGVTQATCAQVNSCLGALVLKEPVFIPEGYRGVKLPALIELKHKPKAVRIWWQFYQSEGPMGTKCVIDASVPAPVEGIGKVHLVRPNGEVRAGSGILNTPQSG